METDKLRQVQFFVTNRCMLYCDGCPHSLSVMTPDEVERNKKEELSVEKWQETAKYFHNLGVRLFCTIGGEPTAYEGIEKLVGLISKFPDTANIVSTSGIVLLGNEKLRRKLPEVGMNAVAVSCDTLPAFSNEGLKPGTREYKAWAGVELVRLLREENPGVNFTFVANVMLGKKSLPQLLDIIQRLSDKGIYTNICPRQTKNLREKNTDALADALEESDKPNLEKLIPELLKIKRKGGFIANSDVFIAGLSGKMGMQELRCWGRSKSPWSIDVRPNGEISPCHWLRMSGVLENPPLINVQDLISGRKKWEDFSQVCAPSISEICPECSWSKEDRVGLTPEDPSYPNIWYKFAKSSS